MASDHYIPPAVTRLLSARYPTLDVDPSWLTSCVEKIRQRDATLRIGSPDQLARAVRQELLDSDLTKVVTASYSRINANLLSSLAGKAGDAGRGAILVQIESMIDIGYSASSQLEIAEARREARRANVDPNDAPATAKAASSTSNAEADHMADFQAQEDDKITATTVFPRRMLKLELSDGSKGANVFAIELQRISGLDMNTNSIGTKLLLKGALVKDGYLLLTPQTVSVEGGCVREKDKVAEGKLIDKLRSQLGKAPQSEPSSNGQQQPPRTNSAVEKPPARTDKTASDRGFSPDDDESELLAALAAEEGFMITTSSTRTRPEPAAPVAGYAAATTALAPGGQRAALIVPETMAQSSSSKPRSQSSNTAATKASATQKDPILIDSDDDELFASVPDELLHEIVDDNEDFGRQQGPNRQTKPAPTKTFNSREDPIVIDD